MRSNLTPTLLYGHSQSHNLECITRKKKLLTMEFKFFFWKGISYGTNSASLPSSTEHFNSHFGSKKATKYDSSCNPSLQEKKYFKNKAYYS